MAQIKGAKQDTTAESYHLDSAIPFCRQRYLSAQNAFQIKHDSQFMPKLSVLRLNQLFRNFLAEYLPVNKGYIAWNLIP